MIVRSLLSLLLLASTLGRAETKALPANNATAEHPFYIYNFGRLTEQPATKQVEQLRAWGYAGLALSGEANAGTPLADYLKVVDTTDATFKIFSVFVRYNFNEAEASRERWQKTLDQIAGRGIDLWFIFGKPMKGVDDALIERVLGEVADAAKARGVNVVLYPHSLCYIASAEAALPFVKKLNRPNLGLAVHLFHEMRAGNGNRIEQVITNVAPYLRAATLAGTNAVVDFTSTRTMDQSTVKPLTEGDYDLGRFARALAAVNYRGPVGFINFKLPQAMADYAPSSLTKWRKIEAAAFAPAKTSP